MIYSIKKINKPYYKISHWFKSRLGNFKTLLFQINRSWCWYRKPVRTSGNKSESKCKIMFLWYHGTIITRTGITCKKISCYMHDSACRWLIEVMSNIFEFSHVKEILEPWLVYAWSYIMRISFHESSNHVSWSRQYKKLVPASFTDFIYNFMRGK